VFASITNEKRKKKRKLRRRVFGSLQLSQTPKPHTLISLVEPSPPETLAPPHKGKERERARGEHQG